MKLQHSGLATVAVYHVPHRVVHHNDTGRMSPTGLRGLAPSFGYRRSHGNTLDRGPDFAERSLIQSSTVLACNVAHTAQHYFVVDIG
jgi:hypothetical protein